MYHTTFGYIRPVDWSDGQRWWSWCHIVGLFQFVLLWDCCSRTQYGIQGKLWSWSADCFRGRKQQVTMEGCQSTLAMVLSGIPQGSVLGPFLFVIFVNEMTEPVHSSIVMFADDTKVFTEIWNEEDATKSQEDLTAPQGLSQIWQLRFKPDKCHVLHLASNNQKYKYNRNKSTDEQTTPQATLLEEDLGVLIDPTLTFSSHCEA